MLTPALQELNVRIGKEVTSLLCIPSRAPLVPSLRYLKMVSGTIELAPVLDMLESRWADSMAMDVDHRPAVARLQVCTIRIYNATDWDRHASDYSRDYRSLKKKG